jgi:hypothetical protein
MRINANNPHSRLAASLATRVQRRPICVHRLGPPAPPISRRKRRGYTSKSHKSIRCFTL